MLQAIYILATAVLLFLVQPTYALAVQEFTTSYDSRYVISESGQTNVSHHIVIKNNLSQIFPKSYTLSISGNKLTSVQATDKAKLALPLDTTETIDQTSVQIGLNNPNIGQNQENIINLSYTTQDIVQHNNDAWEINIPRLKQGSEMASVRRTVVFPVSLGTPTSAVPTPSAITSTGNSTEVTYENGQNESISLLFGKSQWYSLNLIYHVAPPLTKNSYTEISLPPDTAYQRIILESLDPAPKKIVVDQDGNWLARYPYQENFQTTVSAKLFVEISPLPVFKDPSAKGSSQYLASSEYWPVEGAIIKRTAEQLKSPKNIYDFLLATFSYNASRVAPGATRLGGAKALESPSQAICTEFTDTFVTLARSLKIPSREINGFALSNNQALKPLSSSTDILHAWPEYFDQNTQKWLQVDPTWGKTTGGLDYFNKLDYSHITFVRHGLESTYPYPAGSYKNTKEDKTIAVELVGKQALPDMDYQLTNNNNHYSIKNNGKIALVDYTITLPDKSTHLIGYLPPFGEQQIDDVLGTSTNPLTTFIEHLKNYLTNLLSKL